MKLTIVQIIFMSANFVYWLRLFENYVVFIQLIKQTLADMMTFLSLYLVIMVIFGSVMYTLNLNRDAGKESLYDDEIFSDTYSNVLFSQFIQSLGEFNLDNFSKATEDDSGLDWSFFIVSTLFVNLVIFNSIIAIMGDTFDRVYENKQQSILMLKIQVLGEYSFLFQYLKDSAYLFIATLKNKGDSTEEVWEGKIKAINKKVDSGFSNMEKDILQKIRKEVRSENEEVKKQVKEQSRQIG